MSSMNGSDQRAFERALRAAIKGDVYFDRFTLGVYATDASIYQITPEAVVLPRDEADVRAAVQAAAHYGVSLLPRGSGTSLGGQAAGPSVVIDFSKYMNRILELNVAERWVRVQPGLVLDELNAALARHGLHFAPDPATSSRATIGGMMGNNSAGTKSIVYGLTQDHVLEAKTLLADGTAMQLKALSSEEYRERCRGSDGSGREAEILSGFRDIIEENREDIEKSFPKVLRSVQGYNLDAFIHTDRWNLCELAIGSEGTLCLFLEAKLNLEPIPRHKVLCTIHFAELLEGIRTVAPILDHGPSAVELMDADVVVMARSNLTTAPLCGFMEGDPRAILVVEFFGETAEQALQKARTLVSDLQRRGLGYAWPVITDPSEQAKVWSVRKSGLGLMLGIKGNRKPLPFIEDCAVPVDILPEYIDRVCSFCKEREVPVAMYAHASVGTIHVRPVLDLREGRDIQHLKDIAKFTFRLVKQYGGAWSGEHGDGRVRSPFLEEFFGPRVYEAMRRVKRLFDPRGLMNPGPIIDPNPIDRDLRYGVSYKAPDAPTEYHYREDGSFAAAVEMCTGVGACRQTLEGTMCPSYRVTRDEEHSTRGRANALRLAMTGQLGPDGMDDPRLFEVLDLCLSCKSCKSECPSNVDMARLKGEFLQRRYDRGRVGIRDRMIAGSADMASLFCGFAAPFVNFVQNRWISRKMMQLVAGFDSRRRLPAYARVSLPKWLDRRRSAAPAGDKRVVLFDDTYMNYYDTHVGISAVQLLESCGYRIVLARAGCCQRPKISHGLLRDARTAGETTLRNLDRYIQEGLTVVVCEPGCASALTDDLPDLIDDVALGERIKRNVMMIDMFLAREMDEGKLTCEFISPFDAVLIHGHCHQKALYGTTAMKHILDRVPGMDAREIDSGCCGMAGSFGYEKEHYDLSMEIGEQRLFPAIRGRDRDAAVVACGFSCRHQIAAGTGVGARHWVETVRGTV